MTGARAARVHYRLFSVWTLVPVRLGKQLSGNSTVDEIASEAADCRLTQWRIVLKGGSTHMGPPMRKREGEKRTAPDVLKGRKNRKKEKEGGREKGEKSSKKRGLVVLGSGEENPGVLFRDADQESKTRIRKNALRIGRRQAVERATSKRGYHTG
ncbi:hypothetical protein TNCV_1742481 [Trichonephila clavipes]|nr:hypothetical protein TNCV_1742481 [Trichonephila clavipes]